MQGQICHILRPQLAMNRFLPLWPSAHTLDTYIWGEGGGALILDRCRAFDLFASVDAHLWIKAHRAPNFIDPQKQHYNSYYLCGNIKKQKQNIPITCKDRNLIYMIGFSTTYYLAEMLGGFSVPQYTPLVVFRGISTTDSESYRHRPPPELKGHVAENALVKQRVSQKTPKITFSGIS